MKKNNKGFMLVEVIIVAVVVATIMTSLFVVFNRVYNAYDIKSKYTDIDSIYALKMIEDAMIDTEFGSSFLLNENINKLSSGSSYVKIECNTTNSDFDNYCNSLFDEYNVNEMYILKNEATFINSLKNDVSTQTFKEYLEYLDNIGVYNNGYSKLLVVETYVINDDKNILNKYAYLPIK